MVKKLLFCFRGYLLLPILIYGCAGPTVFLDKSFDFNYVERVAVLPFENLSQSQTTSRQATLVFITELLASETYNVIEPGETAKVLATVNPTRGSALDLDQIKALGKSLNVQALILGTVNESTTYRSGAMTVPIITMEVRMVETETGNTVWSALRTEGRPGFFRSLLGLSGKSSAETMRDCTRSLLKTLIQ